MQIPMVNPCAGGPLGSIFIIPRSNGHRNHGMNLADKDGKHLSRKGQGHAGPARVAVLGAGLAGLRGADVLSEAGVDVLVIEKEQGTGGLASTVAKNGFRFDLGPHRFHTENAAVLEYVRSMIPGELMELERRSRIRLLDRYFRYPLSFGDVLGKMPLHRSIGMTMSYFARRSRELFRKDEAEDFRGWVTGRFGGRLYDLYFGPYTEKLWGCSPDELSADWASQRITVPRLTDLARATLFPRSSGARTLVSRFHYPTGGIGRISEAMASRVRGRGGTLLYSSRPSRITPSEDGGYIVHLNGEEIRVDGVLSSIPVTEYAELLGDAIPEKVRDLAAGLRYRAIVFLIIKLRNGISAADHWIYIPEEKYLFNRVSFPGNFDHTADIGGSQLVFEYTCDVDDQVWSGGEDLVASAIEGGARLGLFRGDDVTASMCTKYAHAYPVYSLQYSRSLTPLLEALDRLEGSVTCGRQGLFRYNNMDHSIEMGECAALELLGRGRLKSRFQWTSDTWADG
jgi:protoporphyrinogen oxidase